MTKTLQRAVKLMCDLVAHRTFLAVTLRRPNLSAVGMGIALAVFLGFGLVGAHRYVGNFLAYRGFDTPKEPGFVAQPGTAQRVYVRSAALGGRKQEVYVYLPSGYG